MVNMLGNEEAAFMVTQQAFVAAMLHKNSLLNGGEYTYERLVGAALKVIEDMRQSGELLAPTESVDASLDTRSANIQQALFTLPERDRLILLTKDEQQLTYEQIGRVFGLTFMEVKKSLARIRRALLDVLHDSDLEH